MAEIKDLVDFYFLIIDVDIDAYLDFYTSTVRVLALQQLFIEGENIHQYVDSLTFVQGLSYLRQGAELGNEDAAKKLKQLEDEER